MSASPVRRSIWSPAGIAVVSLAILLILPSGALAQSPQPSAGSSAAPVAPIVPVAPLTQPRQRHTATVLVDGTILLIGGWAHGVGELGSMERYDPLTGSVAAIGDLARPRSFHTATLLPDGGVLVVGGTTIDTVGLASAELVEPPVDPNGLATVIAVGDLAQGRAHHIAVPVLGDGHVLIIGGAGADGPAVTAELYDPVTRTFSPVPSLEGDLTGAAAVRLGDAADAKVLISGGHDAQSNLLYDPVSGLTATLSPLPARSAPSASLLTDGRVLVAGGTQPDDGSAMGTALIWDPATELQVADLDLAAGPRAGPTATVLSDGRVYVAGGTGPDGEPLATAELFDPAADSLVAATAVTGVRFESTVSALSDGYLLVAGGNDEHQTLAALELLQPTQLPPVTPTPTPVDPTAEMRVRPICDQAQVLKGRGLHGLPVNVTTGAMDTTMVRTLDPGDRVTVDREPVAGGSYDSSCTGAADYRWYRVRAVNGSAVSGWIAAQVLVGGTTAYPADPPMLVWSDPVRVARVAFDDVTVDDSGVVHAITATDTGLVYTTNASGRWTSSSVSHHADKSGAERPVYEGQPWISAADGLVVIAYEVRREKPGPGDCAPSPCWENHGISVAILRHGTWTTKQVARFGSLPSVATRDHHAYLVFEDAARVRYLSNVSGSWRTEPLPRVSFSSSITMIAVDSRGRPRIAIGQQVSPSRVSYAHKQGGTWKVETVAGPSALLAGIEIGPNDVVSIGYTRVRDLAHGELCFEDCDRPLDFHVRTLKRGRWTDQPVPGQGFGVFDVDARGRASVLRSDAQLAWRALRSHTWLTQSWKRPWNVSVGSILEPVRRQWMEVRGDTTFLFYRSVDDATWMIEGTLPST